MDVEVNRLPSLEGRTEKLRLQLTDSVLVKIEEPGTMWLASQNALDPKQAC